MNILLIWPPSPDYCILNENFSCCEPLGLEYVAAPLTNEHSVDIVDMRFEKNIIAILESKKYDIVCLSIPYTTSVNVCNSLLKQIKEFDKNLIVIVGGHYPTITFKHMYTQYIDYAVLGEGVYSLYELVKAIEENRVNDSIKGIAILKDGSIKFTENRLFTTLDDYPAPARQLVSKYRDSYFHAHYKPVAMMRFSAGCPHCCSFCVLWKLTGRKYITRSNDLIIEELQEIECPNIYVVDDEAFIDTEKMYDLGKKIIDNNIKKKFHMYVRSDSVANNPELFALWAKAGLDSVLVGLESVFENDLKGYNKSISEDTAYKCIEILHKNNVEVRANFIVKPEYSREDFQRIKDMVFKLDIDRPTFAVLTPFYGTDEHERVKDKFIIDKLEFFDCYHTFQKTKLPLKEFYKEFADLFRAVNARDQGGQHSKVFYGGAGGAFDEMTQTMEDSYLYYIEK